MSDGIDAFSQPADDSYLTARQVRDHLFGDLFAVNGCPPRADHCQAPLILRQQIALDIKYGRIIIYLFESAGIFRIVRGKDFNAVALELFHLGVRIYFISPLVDGAQGSAVQTGAFHLAGRSLPGRFQAADKAFELSQPYPADARDIIKAYPVFYILVQSNFNSSTGVGIRQFKMGKLKG